MSERKYSEYELINKIIKAFESVIEELPINEERKAKVKEGIRKSMQM